MTEAPVKGPLIGVRHLQVGLLFICILVTQFSKLNLAISLVAMTNADTTNPNYMEFDWSSMEISYILSSFYWGNVFTQFLGGYLCRIFGVKLVLFIGIFVNSLLVLTTPVCVCWGGWQAFVVIRILMGAFQGLIMPGVQQHLANWAPMKERTRLGAITYTGFDCGSICAMLIPGLIASSSWGWPGISYVSGSLSLGWCIIWLIFCSNNPRNSKFIGETEYAYISKSQSGVDTVKIPIPWRAILSSIPFIALLLTRCCCLWSLIIVQTEIPSYLNNVLNLNIKQNGLYSALPFFGMWLLSYVYMIIADIILGRKCLTLTQLRKTFNTISLWVPALSLVGMSFLSVEHKIWAIVLMTLGESATSGGTIGSILNSIDLSPNHVGLLIGIINTVSAMVALCIPIIVGAILTDENDRSQWQIVFGITALISFAGSVIFIIWGTAETQPWNDADYLSPRFISKFNYK